MSHDDAFDETNPFRKLPKKAFPSKKGAHVTPVSTTAKGKSTTLTAVQDTSDAEVNEFLDAMRYVKNMTPSKTPTTPPLEHSMPLDLLPPTKATRHARHAMPTDVDTQAASQTSLTMASDMVTNAVHIVDNATLPGLHTLPSLPDEDDIFFHAVQQVTPLFGKGRKVPMAAPELPFTSQEEQGHPLDDFMAGKIEFALASTHEYIEGHVIGLDIMLLGKLQAGQFSPEAHIDLHGLNAQQACLSLVNFFKGAYYKSYRTVLVVPGRGLNSPMGLSVLREKVQEWFTQDPLKRVILAFCTAKPTDGGPGALYVLLRKYKKNHGKIAWQRMPVDPDMLL